MIPPDAWQAGDLALCVADAPLYPEAVHKGAVLTVECVWRGVTDYLDASHVDTALDFVGVERVKGDLAYWHANFRRIRPLTPNEHLATIVELEADQIITAPVVV